MAERRSRERVALRPARPLGAARADLHRLAGARAAVRLRGGDGVHRRCSTLPHGHPERPGAVRRDSGLRPGRGGRSRADSRELAAPDAAAHRSGRGGRFRDQEPEEPGAPRRNGDGVRARVRCGAQGADRAADPLRLPARRDPPRPALLQLRRRARVHDRADRRDRRERRLRAAPRRRGSRTRRRPRVAPAGRIPYRIEIVDGPVLRCWEPGDAALLKDAVDSSLDHLREWMPWAHDEPQSLDEKVELLRLFRGNFDLGKDFVYGIFSPDESEALGGAGLAHARRGRCVRDRLLGPRRQRRPGDRHHSGRRTDQGRDRARRRRSDRDPRRSGKRDELPDPAPARLPRGRRSATTVADRPTERRGGTRSSSRSSPRSLVRLLLRCSAPRLRRPWAAV